MEESKEKDFWTDKMLARLGHGLFMVILTGNKAEEYLGESSPNAALTLFAHVMTFAKNCYKFTEEQGLICLKVFCKNLEMACNGLHFPDDYYKVLVHKVMNSPELDLRVVDDLLDPVLDHIEDDKLYSYEPINYIK